MSAEARCQFHTLISDPGVYVADGGFVRHWYCEDCEQCIHTESASLSEYLEYQSDRAAARWRLEHPQEDDGCPF